MKLNNRFLVLLAFVAICFMGTVSAAPYVIGPGDDINDAIIYASNHGFDSVYLSEGIYVIDSTVLLEPGVALEGEGTIKLEDNAEWYRSGDYTDPLIAPRNDYTSGYTIRGITIDGNARNQNVPFGRGYYNMLEFNHCNYVVVDHVTMIDGSSDGLKFRSGSYVWFTNNTVDKVGHDAFYCLYSKNIIADNNNIFTRTNSGIRLSGGENATISHNEIYTGQMSEGSSTGPGIEIDLDGSDYTRDVEICYNYIHDLNGSGIWLTSANRNGQGVYIHNNIIENVGNYPRDNRYSTAGITIFQFSGTIIENNVFDDTGLAAIRHAQSVDSANSGQYETIVRNNIIVNVRDKITITAIPIMNTYSKNHKFVVYFNNFYNNYDTFDGQVYEAWSNYALNPEFADPAYHLKATSSLIGIGYNGANLGAYVTGAEIIGTYDTNYAPGDYGAPGGPGWPVDNSTLDNSTVEDDNPCSPVDNSTYDYDEEEDNDNQDVDNSTYEYEEPEDEDDGGYLEDNDNSSIVDNSTTDVDNSTAPAPKKKHRSGKSYNLASYPSGNNTVPQVNVSPTNGTKLKMIVGIAYQTTPTYSV